jgi:glycosyltransferase involved in cell wall biosynthesis
VAKQDNLRKFVELADPRFAQAGISFDVIGDVPSNLLDELKPKVQATRFLGFVDAVAPYFAASRIAVVPEQIGGGFKLKFLDYFFARVPVAAMNEAAAGLPEAIRDALIGARTLEELVDGIVANIDDLSRLNALQADAYSAASGLFDWSTRGESLLGDVSRALSAGG